MKGIFEPSTFCKCSRRLPTSGKFIIAAALAAMMLISLTACGKATKTLPLRETREERLR